MPEGPFGAPRVFNLGPLSRSTQEELEENWDKCPQSQPENQICVTIKQVASRVLEHQAFIAECDDLVDINSGSCFNVARSVKTINSSVEGLDVMKAGDYDHVWLRYDGKHYDAEKPTGVEDFRDLPFFDRIPEHFIVNMSSMAAKAEGRSEPETLEDTVEVITDEV